MQIEVKVPTLSESVSEATLVAWHKKVGEAVKRDENLIDIETDKVVMELPAPADGVLIKIVRGDASIVVAGEVIAMIDTEAKVAAVTAATAPPVATHGFVAPAVAPAAVASSSAAMSPAAAKIATENNLNAGDVAGTGRGGRITKEDVVNKVAGGSLAALPATSPATSLAPSPAAKPAASAVALQSSSLAIERSEQRVPMSRLRARIAERLVQSQSTAAILTTFNEVNMAPIIAMRNLYKDKFEKEHGVKLGFMSFFVKAAVHALKKYPVVNASIDGNDIVYHGFYDIGIAVGTERGLVVPVLRDADQMSIAGIEKQIAAFGQKAKDGKMTIEDLSGGTFSISNGGVFGSMLSTPIINPPQSAILGVHATKERAVVENGVIVIRPINYLALSYDHRIIDGREAVLSLVAMKEALEDPARLLLDI